ncbi:type II secretion system GspH family protein [Sporosarcina luteola]|uniref:PulJ/GspJ family protein n=1 Tax=Sporosarcina luteola TaxID=582850 RepID=UPI00203E74FA|nr:type II secretion system protein [Sporosarcina luteola]MCM3637271.1 type II secretion system GspH family protein [Sporosarcina luteola]
MRSHKVNEKGMTLVEILAALVILGIVFVGFMTVFPQMTLINSKTEAKLESMNIAKREFVELKDVTTDKSKAFQIYINGSKGKNLKKIITYIYDENDYQIKVDYYEDDENNLKKNSHPNSIQLNKIHIQVIKEGKVISETFGYIEQ